MKFDVKGVIGIILGLSMVIGAAVFLRDNMNTFYFILVLAGIVVILPFFISFLAERARQKEKEKRFLEFVRDLVENVKSGTPISKGIINLKMRNYGALSENVEKLANQISLGIPLTKALFNFSVDARSKVISRSVGLISEAEKAGGQIDSILDSVSKSVNQTQELKEEQKSAVYNLVVQGYIIFFVFIVIMLVLQYQILPMTAGMGDTGSIQDLSIQLKSMKPEEFAVPLFFLLLVQSLFCGLVIGKISEGNFKDGIKHSFVLLALTLLITTGTKMFLG